MPQELHELIVGDAAVIEVHNSKGLFAEVMTELGFKVSGAGGQDYLMRKDLLIFNNEGNITKLFLVQEAYKVPLF